MSIQAVNWALSQQLDPAEKIILIVLSNYADENHTSFPSMKTIANLACLSRSTSRRKIINLEKRGLLQIEGRARDKNLGQTSNRYYLKIGNLVQDLGGYVKLNRGGGQTDQGGMSTGDQGGMSKSRDFDTPLSKDKRNPKKAPSLSFDFTESFQKRWERYPSKIGRPQAFVHYQQAIQSLEDEKQFDLALKNYMMYCQVNTWYKPMGGNKFFDKWQDWLEWESEEKQANDMDHQQKVMIATERFEKYREEHQHTPPEAWQKQWKSERYLDAYFFVQMHLIDGYSIELLDEIIAAYGQDKLTGNFTSYKTRKAAKDGKKQNLVNV